MYDENFFLHNNRGRKKLDTPRYGYFTEEFLRQSRHRHQHSASPPLQRQNGADDNAEQNTSDTTQSGYLNEGRHHYSAFLSPPPLPRENDTDEYFKSRINALSTTLTQTEHQMKKMRNEHDSVAIYLKNRIDSTIRMVSEKESEIKKMKTDMKKLREAYAFLLRTVNMATGKKTHRITRPNETEGKRNDDRRRIGGGRVAGEQAFFRGCHQRGKNRKEA